MAAPAWPRWLGDARAEVLACAALPALGEHAAALAAALDDLERVTRVLLGEVARGGVRLALANASSYLDLCGHVLVAWTWLRQARVSTGALAGDVGADADLHRGKLAACAFFFRYELPRVAHDAQLLAALDDTTLRMDPDHF
jgi:hypothetical protein